MLGLVLLGCAPPPPKTIPRVVDGEIEQGPSVSPYAYHWFIRGEVYATKDAQEAAALAFETAQTAPTEDALLLTRLAEAYERSGQRRQADRALGEAKRMAPTSEAVWLTQGLIHQARDRPEDALRAYRLASELAPQSSSAPIAIARLLQAKGQAGRAQAVLQAFVQRTDGDRSNARNAYLTLAERRGDFAAVLALANDTDASLQPARTRSSAASAARRGMPVAAANLMKKSATSQEDMSFLVDALLSGGQLDEARAFLGKPPKDRFGDRLDRAELYLASGRADIAARLALRAPDSPRARYVRGAARLAQHRYDEAAREFASVPYGSKDHDRAREGLVACMVAMRQEGVALELIERSTIPSRVTSAELYDALGEHAAAVGMLASDRSVEQLARARLLERLGRRREAHLQYGRIDQRRIADPSAQRRIRAERAVANDELDDAVAELFVLRKMAPEDLWARARLSEVLELQGKTAAAKRERDALRQVAHQEALIRWLSTRRTDPESARRAP